MTSHWSHEWLQDGGRDDSKNSDHQFERWWYQNVKIGHTSTNTRASCPDFPLLNWRFATCLPLPYLGTSSNIFNGVLLWIFQTDTPGPPWLTAIANLDPLAENAIPGLKKRCLSRAVALGALAYLSMKYIENKSEINLRFQTWPHLHLCLHLPFFSSRTHHSITQHQAGIMDWGCPLIKPVASYDHWHPIHACDVQRQPS